MAKIKIARVTLNGCASHTRRNRTFKKGIPQPVSDPDEIKYYEGVSAFVVSYITPMSKEVEQIQAKKSSEKKEKKRKLRRYSEEELTNQKKTTLFKIAKKIDALITGDEKKPELVEIILETQKELFK